MLTAKPHYGAFDVIARDPKFSPYLYVLFESAFAGASNAANGQPAWRVSVKWAAPLFRAPALAKAAPTESGAAAATSSRTTKDSTSEAPASPELVKAGEAVYVANCASCHNANGTGGVGPTLHYVAVTKTYDQTVDFIEKPAGAMPKLYPGTLSEAQVKEVAAYIRATFH